MPNSLELELEAPHMRPEALPWESVSSVKTFANMSVQKSLTMVSLPAAVDLTQLVLPGEAGEERRLMTGQETLHVEIQGYDNGVTFSLGKASIPLPTMPVMTEQSSTSHLPVRVCLTGAEGVRTGTLVGAFRAYWSSAGEPPRDDVDPNLNIILPQQLSEPGPAAVESQEKISEDAIDQEAEHPTLGEHSGDPNHQEWENQAIALLDEATRVLAASRFSYTRRQRRPSNVSAAAATDLAFKDPKERGDGNVHKRQQVSEAIPADTWGTGNPTVVAMRSASPPENKLEKRVPPRFPTAGFKFEPTTGSVDWHRVATVNVSKIEREGDLQTLRQFLPDVAVGKVDDDDNFDTNPGLLNAFRLAQLQAQYVLHCQQVLQRQFVSLQTAVAGMELETEGNLQGTKAMKNSARLLRKENRKQDKIINGYAAMLRIHNPGLASKVFLDDKGRLKVRRLDDAARRRDHRGRRSERRNRRRKYRERRVDKTTGDDETPSNGTERGASPAGSAFSHGNGSSDWSEARGGAPRTGRGPRPSITPMPAPAESFKYRDSGFSLDNGREQDEGRVAAPSDIREALLVEGGRSPDVRDGIGERVESLGATTARGGGGRGDLTHGGTRLDAERQDSWAAGSSLSRGTEGFGVEPTAPRDRGSSGAAGARPGSGGDGGSTLSLAGTDLRTGNRPIAVAGAGGKRGSSGMNAEVYAGSSTAGPATGPRASRSQGGDSAVGSNAGGVASDDSGSLAFDGWRGTSSGSPMRRGGSSRSGEEFHGDRRVSGEGLSGVDRSPRVVTVAVKPKKTRPTSAGEGREGHSTSPPSPQQRDRRLEANDSATALSARADGSGETSVVALDAEATLRENERRRSGTFPEKQTTGGYTSERPAPLSGGVTVARADTARLPGSGGTQLTKANKLDVTVPASPSLVTDAARLGLEGDEFPDLLDFDLDDISEIDAGGEWAGSAAGSGSLSS
ncbi:similar to DAZ interacting protein 1-like isoform 1 [Ectocarpus siliculosus]|uniref:Similar to DAZ interacting protein 1-like isoform 1 n=1 Tax=Ectocarpus siliculosus TaxID=2880 RepID=D7G5R4_ECTSI|nr:similar to DAZ interacting protein 1-like isoform 1 [Ectocarpus siliculosus]|eukprot:CBJ27361.1 similar to DAZ interacting protein 1-like isoform 1 [Ectocarpus siliculosus]